MWKYFRKAIYHDIPFDNKSGALGIIHSAHHEIHDGDAYTVQYSLVTAATDAHRTGIYIKTADKDVHLVVSFSASAAADFAICEAPTIAADTGTDGVAIYNRNRKSANESTLLDNAGSPATNKVTTITEAQFAGDGTWAQGTVIRTEPLQIGVGPRPAGGAGRDSQEYILKANTAYVLMITNNGANANTHHILLDWYEHTPTYQ